MERTQRFAVAVFTLDPSVRGGFTVRLFADFDPYFFCIIQYYVHELVKALRGSYRKSSSSFGAKEPPHNDLAFELEVEVVV